MPTASQVSRSSAGTKHNALRARSYSVRVHGGLDPRPRLVFRPVALLLGSQYGQGAMRNGRGAARRPAQPRSWGSDDIAPSGPEIDSRAKSVAPGHYSRVMLQDNMPAAEPRSLYGRFGPSLVFSAKMALCARSRLPNVLARLHALRLLAPMLSLRNARKKGLQSPQRTRHGRPSCRGFRAFDAGCKRGMQCRGARSYFAPGSQADRKLDHEFC